MYKSSISQKAPLLPLLVGADEGQDPSPCEHPDEKTPSSSSQHIQVGDADTAHADTSLAGTNEVPTHQGATQFPEQCDANGFNSDVPGNISPSLEQAEIIATVSESGSQNPSLEPSAPTPSDDTDVSTVVASTHSMPSIPLKSPDSVPSTTKPQYTPRLPLSESLGLEGCGGIIGGFVGILGIFGFLSYLWFGYGSAPEAAKATWVWRQLAIRTWMHQAVTLASIILRFVIGVQATICTSMLAALLLERLSVPHSQVAYASVMRGINDGPWKLVMLLFSYKGKASYIIWHLEAWLIILVAFLSLSLQFTPTILLSDMHPFRMVGDPSTTTVNSLFAYPGFESLTLFQGNIKGSNVIYPVFGDVSTTHNSSPDARGFSDTGLKQRGLLPMSQSDNRTSVREYDGMSMVMSSRVACMRPIIRNVTLHLRYGWLQGVLDYGQSLQEARPRTDPACSSSNSCEAVAFQCEIGAANNLTGTWAATGCAIDGVGGRFRGEWEPSWDPAAGPWSENSSIWLVYSTNLDELSFGAQPPARFMPLGLPSVDSEWSVYEVMPGYFIKLAVCFSAFNFAHRDTHMTAAGETRERSKSWSMELNKGSSIDETARYLGLNPTQEAIADRGILDLQINPHTPYTPSPPFAALLNLPPEEVSPSALAVNVLQHEMNIRLGSYKIKNTTFMLCQRCSITDNATQVNDEYAFLFSNFILGDSHRAGRAADALHAFITMAGFNLYYQFLEDTMDVSEQVRVVTTREVTVPGSWPPSTATCAGFIAVASLLAAYVTVVTVVTTLYVRHTHYSRYGNVWHVISQLVASQELEDTLELGNNAGDKAVMEGLRAKRLNKEDVMVKLIKVDDGCEKVKVKKSGTE